MMGSFFSRALLLAFGYAYPAYQCYKTVELNKPEIQKLIFWCQYWILIALLTVLERFADAFVSWLPMYNEAKVAFFIYLWYPKTMGAPYIYETFFRPYISSRENDIDRNLLELRARASDVVVLYWQKATSYGQTTFFDALQYVASQSSSLTSRSRSAQQKEQQYRRAVSMPSVQQPAAASQPAQEATTTTAINPSRMIRRLEPFKAKPITRPAQPQEPAVAAADPPPADPAAEPPTSKRVYDLPSTTSQPIDEAEGDGEMPIEDEEAEQDGETAETPMEEAIRVTHNKLRKRVATAAIPSAGS